MKESIKQHHLKDEFFTPEKCYITELSNTPDDSAVSIARARVESGVTTAWHHLIGIAERYYIISGTGRVEIGNRGQQDVHPGDIVTIPPMCRQRITNIGQNDLVFLAICTPRFSNDAYVNLERSPNS
jgi:mannose-6-phosphate isomerase-like protein (cupin superfamily)